MTLARTGVIPIPAGAAPGFDHADVYRPGRRMYVAHTGANRVDVLDCERQMFLRSLTDLPGVAGVLIDEHDDLLVTTDRAASRVSVFRCSDEHLQGHFAGGPHPNGIAYDPARRRLFAFNLGEPLGENCSVSVIQLDPRRVLGELPLPGRPRWALYDRHRDRVYANIRDPAQIVIIDPGRLEIVDAFAVPCPGPHGLWLDENRLYCATDGGALVVLDAESGDVQQILTLPGVPDVVMHDATLARLYVAVGDPGVICCFDTESELSELETVETERDAHSCGWDPDGRRLYVFCPASGVAVFEEQG